MEVILDKGNPDILIPAEGTYPYVRGGVSSWIAQLMQGLPQYTFGIAFIGSRRQDYPPTPLFKFPDNLVYMVQIYMFDEQEQPEITPNDGDPKAFEMVEELHEWFKHTHTHQSLPDTIRHLNFYLSTIDESTFLFSRESWKFITRKNQEYGSDIAFIDYFWTVRNIHMPIWRIAKLAKFIGNRGKIVHSPSTGYAGFLATLLSYDQARPYILTEHGIYTKERKIDLLASSLFLHKKLELFQKSDEENYIKTMWVKFFEGIGRLSYHQADHIFSLFGKAQATQIQFGADAAKCRIIPNGVDVERLGATLSSRPETIPPVITLIGRVVSIKDIKTFIRAIRITANTIPDIEGWIVGPDDEDAAYVAECRELIHILDLQDHIKFLGFQNIVDILPQSGLLTLTSISEGMPLVILEGFAAGVPCVSTDVGSCRELIYGGEEPGDQALGSAGRVCQIANPTELAAGYIELLSDSDRWHQAQDIAIKRVNRFYTQQRFLENYRKIYDETFQRINRSWQA